MTILDWVMASTSVLTLLVIAATAGIAWWQLRRAKQREQINNSFGHIAIQTRDHDLIQMFEQFRLARRKLRDGHDGSLGVEQVQDREISYNGRMLMAEDVLKKVFNYYEATAIGVKQEALNEPILRDWWRRSYVLDFNDFALYVYQRRLRDDADKMFIEYEGLARKWASEAEKSDMNVALETAKSWFAALPADA